MKTVTISTLRKGMKEYFDYVSDTNKVIIVPRNGDDEPVVIISMHEYNSLIETEHLMSNDANRKRLQESMEQMSKGKTVAYQLK